MGGAMTLALSRKAEMSVNALAASRQMVWENIEDEFFAALGRPASVSYFGYKDLTRNNRTLRMAGSLAKPRHGGDDLHPRPAAAADCREIRFHLLQPE